MSDKGTKDLDMKDINVPEENDKNKKDKNKKDKKNKGKRNRDKNVQDKDSLDNPDGKKIRRSFLSRFDLLNRFKHWYMGGISITRSMFRVRAAWQGVIIEAWTVICQKMVST